MSIHDKEFRVDFSYTSSLQDYYQWEKLYNRFYPGCKLQFHPLGSTEQKSGIDTTVTLASGDTIHFDEKKLRSAFKGSILLEEWSVCDYDYETKQILSVNRPGWTVDSSKQTDMITYAYPVSNKVIIIPYQPLRRHFYLWKQLILKNKPIGEYPIATGKNKNNGYTTICMLVKLNYLKHFFNSIGLPIVETSYHF